MALPQYTPEAEKDPITQEKERLLESVKDIPVRVGVHAGKGGVGKTFLSVQLALALQDAGKSVGLLDADVDCPNIPTALNEKAELHVTESGKLRPILHEGVKVVSTGFMQDEGEPLIIRGPIKHRLLTDFIEKTDWGALDALVIDFPPGTSDVPLSAMQVANLTGVILVSTPSRSALGDLKRAAAMAKKLGVRVYGVIENMSGDVFGQGGAEEVAKELGLPFICRIPLSKEIGEKAEEGVLAVDGETQAALRKAVRGIGRPQ